MNLVVALLRLTEGKYAAVSDIEQMFHHTTIRPEDQDTLRFLWRDDRRKAIEDHIMFVQVFGKIDSSCIANWTSTRTAKHSEKILTVDKIDQVN